MINGYDFPYITYFTQTDIREENVFTGSEGNNFRYRLLREDGKLKASVWYEDICFEKATAVTDEFFELTADGLVKAIEWLNSQKK